MIKETERRLLDAFRAGEYERVIHIAQLKRDRELARQAEADAKKKGEEIDRQLGTLGGSLEHHRDFAGRRIRLKVTPGSIQYDYLLVSRPIADGELKITETLKINVPLTGEDFETGIHPKNKHLNERHRIRRFYRAAGITAGDFVLLEETAPGEWRLTKCPPAGSE